MNIATPASQSSEILDPAVATLLVSIKEQGFPGWAYLTIEQGRAMMATMRPLAGEPEPVARVEDVVIPGSPDIPARFYLPQGDRPLALVVYFHGGAGHLVTTRISTRRCAGSRTDLVALCYRSTIGSRQSTISSCG